MTWTCKITLKGTLKFKILQLIQRFMETDNNDVCIHDVVIQMQKVFFRVHGNYAIFELHVFLLKKILECILSVRLICQWQIRKNKRSPFLKQLENFIRSKKSLICRTSIYAVPAVNKAIVLFKYIFWPLVYPSIQMLYSVQAAMIIASLQRIKKITSEKFSK